jgi:predicted O-linked N-acetylglucosamine transferase (SPINDLY family)
MPIEACGSNGRKPNSPINLTRIKLSMLDRLIGSIFKRPEQTREGHTSKENALWHYERAVVARAQGNLDEVEAHYLKAIEFDPVAPELCYNLGLLFQEVGDVSKAEKYFRRALDLSPKFQSAHSSFLCVSDFHMAMTREENYSRHLSWAQKFADPLTKAAQPHHKSANPGRRLRVGYVSADFRRHAVGRFVEPILRHHDKSRYEVICYSNTEINDDMTAHIRTVVEQWREVSALSDDQLAAMMRGDNIDVLIDLSGHSHGNRLLVFARKPAPVQISWVGYLNTTGMEAMDYRIVDTVSDPPGTERWYREKLLRLPQPQWCYVPEAGPVVAQAAPVVVRAQDEAMVFACMTRFMKISDAVIPLWAQILQSLPEARLRIVDVPDHFRGRALKQRFFEMGLGDRVEFLPTLFGDAYWQAFDRIDVALDTFPYTGATTTCDCLWMGIPVVTLAGTCGASRSASSLLAALGLGELIADTADRYLAIAVGLGKDRRRVAALRASLRERMKNSPICDPILFSQCFEQQLDIAWTEWREK